MVYRRSTRFLNALIVFSLLGIIYVFIQRPATTVDSATRWDPPVIDPTLFRVAGPRTSANEEVHQQSQQNGNETRDQPTSQERERDEVLQASSFELYQIATGVNVTGRKVVESVEFLNENAEVRNTDKFGPVGNVEAVIVIQVHNRLAYLEILIETLRSVTGIEKTLLVFSHDISINAINEAIRRIDFARVLQIFYPFNLQLFPHVFPGQHSDDCPEKIKQDAAQSKGCRNWKHPDTYKNYRVAKLSQIKHHWWWKMNYVFDRIVKGHNLVDTWVVLLEEDHYVTPDFVHVFLKMTKEKESLCPQCDILCLGTYVKNYRTLNMIPDAVSVAPWYSSKYNMGMALRLSTWNQTKNCSEAFCTYDDYNWDWSLLQVTTKCLPKRWFVMYTKAPRVIHIGDCGVHTHRCDSKKGAEMAASYVTRHASKFFPETLRVSDVSRRSLKPSKPNGGWGDPRDHQLCLRNAFPFRQDTEHEEVLEELYNSAIHPMLVRPTE